MKKFFTIIAFAIAPVCLVQAQAIYQNGAALYISAGSLVHVNGNSRFQSGSLLTNNGTIALTGNLNNELALSESGSGTLELLGTNTQTLSGAGLYSVSKVIINNAAGIILDVPLKVTGKLEFINGIVSALNAPKGITISNTATVSGVSDASHINGYVIKEGIGGFTYPIGNGSSYQPVTADLTDNDLGLQARYFSADAGTAAFTTTGASKIKLESYNSQEYWDLTPVGTATGTVNISWDATNNGSITSSSDIKVFKVAHKTSSGWLNEGSSAVTGNSLAGNVTSETISSWSPITLGVIPEESLPVTLISFTARMSEANTLLNWQTSSEFNASYFDLERSSDARTFEKIAKIQAAGNSSLIRTYYFHDTHLSQVTPITYYRLRQVDQDGTYAYSRLVSVKRNDSAMRANLYPNPSQSYTPLTVESGSLIASIEVWNSSGQKMTVPVSNLNDRKAELNINSLDSGVYVLQVKTADGIAIKKLIVK